MSAAFDMQLSNNNNGPDSRIDEAKDANAASASIQNGSSGSADQSESETEFDAEFFEQTFGLPEGSLKDVTDASSALDMIRTFTDRTLIAGLNTGFSGGVDVPESKAPVAPKAEEKKGEEKKEAIDFEKFKADMWEEFNSKIQAERAAAWQADISRRIASKIDSWASPKYGVGQTRNYKQVKEAQRIAQMVYEHANAARITGQPEPTVEATLERLRLIDDETYTPTKTKPQVGTPGAGGKSGAKGDAAKMPRNIHEALRNSTAY